MFRTPKLSFLSHIPLALSENFSPHHDPLLLSLQFQIGFAFFLRLLQCLYSILALHPVILTLRRHLEHQKRRSCRCTRDLYAGCS